jgi:small multidrug resistance family-3 protein
MKSIMQRTATIFVLAAMAEIGGCFAVWAVFRRGAPLWLMPIAAFCLALFAWLLARSDQEFAGRAYAAYGGVYVAASLLWLWLVEGQAPSRLDLLGGLVILAGSAIILSQARS